MGAKRGQLSAFVIIGVILVVGLGVFLYAKSASVTKEEALPADIAPIKVYVEQCLKSTAEDAVLTVALQGGYYMPPENSLAFLNVNMPYYMYEGNVSVPTQKMIEDELSLYLMINLPFCTDMTQFAERGYNITAEMPQVKTTIRAKEVLFDVDYPITIKINRDEKKMEKFSTNVKAELMKLYDAAQAYMQYQEKDTDSLFVSRLMELSLNNSITFEAFNLGEDNIISLIDNQTMIRDQPLIFAFAVRYPALNTNLSQI